MTGWYTMGSTQERRGGEIHGVDIVAVMSVLLVRGLWSSPKSCLSQAAFAMPLATVRYSTSTLERETAGCRLDD
jgi:hypothetical protein